MKGTLYGVGVGPGDPELMTLKAVRMIRENEIIAVSRHPLLPRIFLGRKRTSSNLHADDT